MAFKKMGGGPSKETDFKALRRRAQNQIATTIQSSCGQTQTCTQNTQIRNFQIQAFDQCKIEIRNTCKMDTACTLGGDDYEKFPWDDIAKLLEELQDTELRDEIAKEIQIEGSIDDYNTADIGLKIRESCSQSQSSYQEILVENVKLACYDQTMYQVLNEANLSAGCVTQALDKVITRVEETRKKEKEGAWSKSKEHIAIGIGVILIFAFFFKPKRKRLRLEDWDEK